MRRQHRRQVAAMRPALLLGADLEQIHCDARLAGSHFLGLALERGLEFRRIHLRQALRPRRQLVVDSGLAQRDARLIGASSKYSSVSAEFF
jgi:hypothetical protein